MNGVDCAGDADDNDEDVDEAEFGVNIPFRLQFKPDEFDDSREAAKELVRLIINPAPIEQFFGYAVVCCIVRPDNFEGHKFHS